MRGYKIEARKKGAGSFWWFSKGLVLCIGIAAAVNMPLVADGSFGGASMDKKLSANAGAAPDDSADSATAADMDLSGYHRELAALLERNEEALDYVISYPDREEYQSQPIDLTQDFHIGEVPLLMQWDRRWGYDAYGDDMIGLSGCGPVCLTMAYLYFTGDTSMTPREMARFAYENGYYVNDPNRRSNSEKRWDFDTLYPQIKKLWVLRG